MNYVLTCCSTVDLTKELLESNNLPFLPYSFHLNDQDYKDDYTYPNEQLYAEIAKGAMPTTSQIPMLEYQEFWTPFLKEGKDVLHITMSSGISGSYNSACMAANEINQEYDNKVVVVDSRCITGAYGMLMLDGKKKYDEGLSLEDLEKWFIDNRLRYNHWFFSTDLTSYIRGGRISKAAGFAGNVLHICPLMNVPADGSLAIVEKIRTKKKCMNECANIVCERADNGYDYDGEVFINHSACLDDANTFVSLLKEKMPKAQCTIFNIGPVIGAHTGPGTIAVFFKGKVRD